MKHRPTARLVIRLLGVYLIVTAAPTLAVFLFYALTQLRDAFLDFWFFVQRLPIGAIARMLIGVYLLLSGRLVLNLVLPPLHRYCPSCGFDLGDEAGVAACPCCGNNLVPAPETP